MTSGVLANLSFTYPWMLAGLAALPAIWLLLRLTPPRPQTVPFPPGVAAARIAGERKDPDPQPLVADLAADAGRGRRDRRPRRPVIKPQSAATAAIAQPLVVVVDNGWAAASRWAKRQSFAEQLSLAAEEGGQTLYLLPTAGPAEPLSPLTPEGFRERFASLAPEPFPGSRAAAAQQIESDLAALRGKVRVAWLPDGVEDAGSARWARR